MCLQTKAIESFAKQDLDQFLEEAESKGNLLDFYKELSPFVSKMEEKNQEFSQNVEKLITSESPELTKETIHEIPTIIHECYKLMRQLNKWFEYRMFEDDDRWMKLDQIKRNILNANLSLVSIEGFIFQDTNETDPNVLIFS